MARPSHLLLSILRLLNDLLITVGLLKKSQTLYLRSVTILVVVRPESKGARVSRIQVRARKKALISPLIVDWSSDGNQGAVGSGQRSPVAILEETWENGKQHGRHSQLCREQQMRIRRCTVSHKGIQMEVDWIL